jgi:hypothetical protein
MSDNNYASDPNAAEKGTTQRLGETVPVIIGNPEPSRDEERTILDAPDTRNAKYPKSLKHMTNPFAQYAAPEAPIWARYLEEAEEEDKELIEPWKSSLDSLLIFVSCLHALNSSRFSQGNRPVCSPQY